MGSATLVGLTAAGPATVAGMSADTVFAAVGGEGSGLAAVAALAAVWYARVTVREARADRREAEQARLIRRVERVGEAVEELEAYHVYSLDEGVRRHTMTIGRWTRAMTGLADYLPYCASIFDVDDEDAVRDRILVAREEVHSVLAGLHNQQMAIERGSRGADPKQAVRAVALRPVRWMASRVTQRPSPPADAGTPAPTGRSDGSGAG